MWKQFLSKLPRPKPSKSDLGADQAPGSYAGDASDPVPWNGNSNSSDPNGRPAVKRMSSAVFPSSVASGIEPLLAFKDVPSQEKQNLFLSKLNLCCVVFDFHDFSSDSSNGSMEKDMKRQTLVELVDFVSAASSKFTEPMISASCKMFAINLFRAFPPNCSRLNATSGGENDEDEPMFDPAWSHLQLVYELMLKIVASSLLDSKVAKKYLDHGFILRLLDLFESEDPRERDCLKTILHRIYGKFMVHRPFIRKSVSNIFYRFVFETERHNGIAELLEVFGSVISGFALPLKEEHKMFLWRALIPLHKPKSVGIYLHQLTYCIAQFIEKEPKLVSTVVGGLLKCWPVTNSQKEVMFLGEMEEVLESTNMAEFQKIMIPMFRRIACCLNSSHFQVAERALFLCNNDHVANLISQNRHVILPIIFPALERNTKHWNQAVLNMTQNVRKMFSDMDEQLFLDCQKGFEEEEQLRVATEEKRRLTWERLESAAVAFQVHKGKPPAIFNTPISPPMIAANLR